MGRWSHWRESKTKKKFRISCKTCKQWLSIWMTMHSNGMLQKKRLARLARNYPFLHDLQGVCMPHIQQNQLKDKLLNKACMSFMRFWTFFSITRRESTIHAAAFVSQRSRNYKTTQPVSSFYEIGRVHFISV